MLGKRIYIAITVIVILLCAGILLAYYLFFTTPGSSFVVSSIFSKHFKPKNINIKTAEGSLSEKLTLKDVQVDDLKGLPASSILKIQELKVYFASLNAKGLYIKAFNGSLKLPGLEPIYFYGDYEGGYLNFNVYTKRTDVRYLIVAFFPSEDIKNLSATINDVDIQVAGSFLKPKFKGEFQIEQFSYINFHMNNCYGFFSINVSDLNVEPKVYGEVNFQNGIIYTQKTATIEIKPSKVLFSGTPKNPQLDLEGASIVGNTKIKITLKGTADKPDLKLASTPPMPEERLLLMLLTGKEWKSAETALSRGQITADIAKDFVDYLLFAGSGGKIAQRYGIDLSLQYDKQTKGFGIKKAISEKAEASYKFDQAQGKEGKTTATHQVGGEYKIMDNISVGGEKKLEIEKKTEEKQADSEIKGEDKIFIKYKKAF